jgi:hypothetical protein
MNPTLSAVRSPLQLFGLYLAWAESALSAGLFATTGVEHWTRYCLMFMMAFGLGVFVLTVAFLLIYLSIKKPGFLFNPGDYDPAVQPYLFDRPTPVLAAPPDAVPARPGLEAQP